MAAAAKTTAMAWSSLLLLSTLATVHVDSASATGGGGNNAGAPAPSVVCTDALLSLAGCLSYVQEGRTVAKPDESCCSLFKDVVRKEVACLFQAFQGSQNLGVTLDMTNCSCPPPMFSVLGVTDGVPAPAPFGGSPPSASPAGTGSDSTTQAPSPSRSAAATFPASTHVFVAKNTMSSGTTAHPR